MGGSIARCGLSNQIRHDEVNQTVVAVRAGDDRRGVGGPHRRRRARHRQQRRRSVRGLRDHLGVRAAEADRVEEPDVGPLVGREHALDEPHVVEGPSSSRGPGARPSWARRSHPHATSTRCSRGSAPRSCAWARPAHRSSPPPRRPSGERIATQLSPANAGRWITVSATDGFTLMRRSSFGLAALLLGVGCVGTAFDGCPPGRFVCEGVCVDLQSDSDHCSACGEPCAVENGFGACGRGQCVFAGCDRGYANCNEEEGDGCETDTRASESDCGACGHRCGWGELCHEGECEADESAPNTLRFVSFSTTNCTATDHNSVSGDDRGGDRRGERPLLLHGRQLRRRDECR